MSGALGSVTNTIFPGLGGLTGMGGLGGQVNSTNTTSTTNNAPWSGVQPYLLQQLAGAQNQFNQGPYGFTQSAVPGGIAYSSNRLGGQTGYIDPAAFLAPQSQNTLAALQMAASGAQDPNGLVSQAQKQLGQTISGQYLDPGTNPAWNPMSQRITDAYSTGTAAQTDAAAARANAIGSSGYNQQTQLNQRALGDSLAGLAGNLYNTERGYQQNALGMAPGMQTANAQILGNVGAQQDAYNQAQLAARQQAYMSPWSNLQLYQGLLQGTGGGTSTTNAQVPYYTNPWATLLGGAVGFAGLGKGLGFGGAGAAGAGGGAGLVGMGIG